MKEGAIGENGTTTVEVVSSPPNRRTEHTCCCLGVLVGVALIAALVAVILMKDTTVEVTALRQVHVNNRQVECTFANNLGSFKRSVKSTPGQYRDGERANHGTESVFPVDGAHGPPPAIRQQGLMSHGERTPSEYELAMLGSPPSDHVFAPYGAGAMTNEGKILAYEMGALLRKRYGDFLGPIYSRDSSVVVASDNNLSKNTALLISAGLWPPAPVQVWLDTMQWQPIPYTYPDPNDDVLLYEENCPRYKQEKERILKAFNDEGLLQQYKDLFQRIALLTGTNFTSPQEAYHLNNLFVIQDDIKVANPKWAKHVKKKLMEIAKLEYIMMFYNTLLRKLSGGALLQQIIKEATSSITPGKSSPRIIVRTGTPVTVAALLSASVASPPRLPDPGAALVFELHERIPNPGSKDQDKVLDDGQRFGLKIYYWDDEFAEPRLMEVPGCTDLCPLDTFRELTKTVVTEDYFKDCAVV